MVLLRRLFSRDSLGNVAGFFEFLQHPIFLTFCTHSLHLLLAGLTRMPSLSSARRVELLKIYVDYVTFVLDLCSGTMFSSRGVTIVVKYYLDECNLYFTAFRAYTESQTSLCLLLNALRKFGGALDIRNLWNSHHSRVNDC